MKFPDLIKPGLAMAVFRATVGIIMFTHGAARVYYRTVDEFGEFLSGNMIPLGLVFAWLITLAEIIGGISLTIGYYRKQIALFFAVEIFAGILLVHLDHGWFVVGHGRNGIEYGVLLLASFLVIISAKEK